MKVKELIKELEVYNQDLEVNLYQEIDYEGSINTQGFTKVRPGSGVITLVYTIPEKEIVKER